MLKRVELSNQNVDQRLHYLTQHGHKFMTIIYIGRHVMLYLGDYVNPLAPTQNKVPLTYQNLWGFRYSEGAGRAVVGGAALIPLLKPTETGQFSSLADKHYFQLGFLDAPTQDTLQAGSSSDLDMLSSP